MKTYALIANPNSRSSGGWNACKEQIEVGLDTDVFLLNRPVDGIVSEIAAAGYKTVIAVGGDGTISCIADAILRIQPELILGVIPAGTLNHFSKDTGIPQGIEEALTCIRDGHTQQVDVGVVNERHFINNSSVGIYPLLVLNREKYQEAGHTKWIAFVRAALKLAYTYRSSTIYFGNQGSTKQISSIFIGNNRYVLEGTGLGGRHRLDESILTILLIAPLSILELAVLSFRALRGNVLSDRAVNMVGVASCQVSGRRKSLLVSYDGEIARMQSPLQYSIKHRALRIIAPVSKG